MPIIWRYLLGQYLKVLLLTVFSFLTLLFVARLEQIAEFASLGTGPAAVLQFALLLIPYVLPVAVPLSCLIAATLLFQRLSHSHELIALRAAGVSMRSILAPVLALGLIASVLNFYIASELASHFHLLSNKMKRETVSLNPLLLLQNSHLLHFGDCFVDARTKKTGEEIDGLLLALFNPATQRIGVLTADRLKMQADQLVGENVSLITALPVTNGHERLLVENQSTMTIEAAELSRLFYHKEWSPKNRHLQVNLLFKRIGEAKAAYAKTGDPAAKATVAKGYTDLIRRFTLGFAAFTLTLLGAVFGIDLARARSFRGTLWITGFAALFLTSFLAAGELGEKLVVASLLYLLPHLLIAIISLYRLRTIQRGQAV